MIRIQQLSKTYHTSPVLNVSELTINAGECIGITGNNGAGKTTMLSLILDLIRPTSGSVLIDGHNVQGADAWKSYTGAYLDENFLPDFLNPKEYFEFIASLKGVNKADLAAFLAEFEELFNGEIVSTTNYIRALSKGNTKKTGIAGAFIGNSRLILLDEPFANLDPSSQMKLRKIISKWHKEKGCTFLISSHDLDQVTEICDRIILIDKGQIKKDLITNENTLKELEGYFISGIDFQSKEMETHIS